MSLSILHVSGSFSPLSGGPYHTLGGMCKALAMRGHRAAIFTTDRAGRGGLHLDPRQTARVAAPREQAVQVDGYEVWHFPAEWPTRWSFSRPLARALAREVGRYDVVHIESLYLFSSQAAAYYCRRASVPYVVRPHGTLDPVNRQKRRAIKWLYGLAFQRRDLNRAATIFCASPEEAEHMRPLGLRAPRAVVPLCFDLEAYRTLPERGRFRAQRLGGWQGLIVLYMGRINFKKGLDLLIDGFAEIRKTRDDALLVIAGWDDPVQFGDSLRQRVKQHGIEDRTLFAGGLFAADKLAALADADVWALPSYGENFGLAVGEAMACGLPVVVSNQVALHRDVQGARAGLVVDCDAPQVGRALARLLADPRERQTLGRNGRRLAFERYGLERGGARLEKFYEAIAAGRTPG